MKNTVVKLLAISILLSYSTAFAGRAEFCAGFEQGYKSIKGNLVVVPVCPVAPVTPVNSTDFQEGIKTGIRAAQR